MGERCEKEWNKCPKKKTKIDDNCKGCPYYITWR